MEAQRVNLEGCVIQQVRNYRALEVDNNRVKDVEPTAGPKDKGKNKEIGIRINELVKVIQIHDSMSPSDIELEKKRQEKDAQVKKLEIVENEVVASVGQPKIVGQVEKLRLQEQKLLQNQDINQEGPMIQQIKS